jgi:hypothetical protein
MCCLLIVIEAVVGSGPFNYDNNHEHTEKLLYIHVIEVCWGV